MTAYSEFYMKFMMDPPESGVAFNNNIYLLQQKQESMRDNTGLVAKQYWISATKCSLVGHEIKEISTVDVSSRMDPDIKPIPSNPVGCIHQGVFHVFWRENGVVTYRESLDGKSWGKSKSIGSSQLDKNAGSIALVSTGDALLVFIPFQNKLHLAVNKDGKWTHYHRKEWVNVKGIAACSFQKVQEPDAVCIMYAMVTTNGNIWTGYYTWHDGELGTIHNQIQHKQFSKAGSVALVQGSVNGGITDNVVQLFVSEKNKRRQQEFSVTKGRWQNPTVLNGEYISKHQTGDLNAFQFPVRLKNGELQQEVILLFQYSNALSTLVGTYSYAALWKSDQLRLVNTTSPEDIDERNKSLWCLLGVIEGPPPYILNHTKFSQGVSNFTFKYQEKTETSTKIETTSCVTFKYGSYDKPSNVQLGGGLSAEFAITQENKTTETVAVGFTKYPQPGVNEAIELYLKPTVVRRDYDVQDYKGNAIGIHAYVFSVSQWSPDPVPVDMSDWPVNPYNGKQPDTNDIESWLLRMQGLPPFADQTEGSYVNRVVPWIGASESNFSYEKNQIEMQSEKVELSFELSAGQKGIFDIGVKGSGAMTVSHQTLIGQNVGFNLRYPAPDINRADDICRVDLRALLMKPDTEQIADCYWVPDDMKEQTPWCLAWSVEGIKTQGNKVLGSLIDDDITTY